jgi:hypothetical protein
MEEGILHIHLIERPIRDRGNGKKAADSNKFRNKGKCFSIVDALPLVATLSDQPDLCLSMEPSDRYLVLKTHLQPMRR